MPHSLSDAVFEADAHRRAAAALLNSALSWGHIGEIASAAGVSRKTLWHLRRIDEEPVPRLPSPKLAQRVARAVPLPRGQQHELLEHLLLSRKTLRSLQLPSQDRDWLDRYAIWEMSRLHEEATFSAAPEVANLYYQAVVNLGRALLDEYRRMDAPLASAQVHLLMHDALNILDRPAWGLYHAVMAESVLSQPDSSPLSYYEPDTEQEFQADYYDLRVNAVRSQAVSYNTLHLYTSAALLCDRALQEEAAQQQPDAWKVHILRDKVKALSRLPGTHHDQLTAAVKETRTISERHGQGLMLLLINESAARAHIRRGDVQDAEYLLSEGENLIASAAPNLNAGQLHRAMLSRTLADHHMKQGDLTGWLDYARQALDTAHSAGLTKLKRELAAAYGDLPAFQNIYEEIIGSRPPAGSIGQFRSPSV